MPLGEACGVIGQSKGDRREKGEDRSEVSAACCLLRESVRSVRYRTFRRLTKGESCASLALLAGHFALPLFGETAMTAIPLPTRAREVKPAPASAPTWDNIDPETLPEDILRHYRAYQKAQAEATAARKLFEEECNLAFDSGPGNRLAFGYKFGKLSVAIVRDAPRASASAKSLASLVKPR